MQRRTFLSTSAAAGLSLLPMEQVQAQTGDRVTLRWLDGAPPPIASGVSWGVPWARGTVPTDQAFSLASPDGATLPLETWPLAYWPDGSLKWSGFATVANAAGPLMLSEGPGTKASVMQVNDGADTIEVDTGVLRCNIPRKGSAFLESMSMDGRVVAGRAHLTCILEDRSQLESSRTIRFQDFTSEITKVCPRTVLRRSDSGQGRRGS